MNKSAHHVVLISGNKQQRNIKISIIVGMTYTVVVTCLKIVERSVDMFVRIAVGTRVPRPPPSIRHAAR